MMRFLRLLLTISGLGMAQEPMLLVLEKGANSLGYYTLEGQRVGGVMVGQHPHEMVLSPDRKYVYITDNGTMRIEQAGKGGNTVSVVDIAAKKRVDTIKLGKYHRPHGIDYDRIGERIVVTAENPDRLILIDAKERKVLRSFETKGRTPHMVSFAPGKSGAEWAYVSNSGSGNVAVVQLTTGGETKIIPTGQRPEGSVLSKDGKELFVTNRESGAITIIDTARQAAIGEIKTGGKGPVRVAVTPDGRFLVYALMHDHKIEITDLATRRPVAQISVDGEPISISVSPDGAYALAASEEIDTVHVISLKERKLLRSFKTPKGAGPDPVVLIGRN